ncbi:hypothetical protein BDA96_07G069400 [Sorghum bicolor]|uniref:Uncharacterized protein n=1 Tax=Sorghum bicolor TaxID=4558 RepID=A0A921U9Q1_SORBI|nr:hypothetical protein BDA96_07G069400 [Sorghum bicolor]
MKRYKGTRKWFARNRQHISHNLSSFSLSTRTAERSPNSHHAPHLHLAAPPGSFAKQMLCMISAPKSMEHHVCGMSKLAAISIIVLCSVSTSMNLCFSVRAVVI